MHEQFSYCQELKFADKVAPKLHFPNASGFSATGRRQHPLCSGSGMQGDCRRRQPNQLAGQSPGDWHTKKIGTAASLTRPSFPVS